jgi:WD40 repeat protein
MTDLALDQTQRPDDATPPPPASRPAPAALVAAALVATQADDAPPALGEQAEPSAPTEPHRYAVVREFAHGGLGRILEAEDTTLHRTVAIKELRVAGGRGQARFHHEALVTARLQHPSIVPLYDIGHWESGEPYYTMRLVSGRPLDEVIAATQTLDQRLGLLPHVIAVADAMAYAHRQRIVHRDLKPSNVMVGEFGETVVIDWGLAKDLAGVEAPGDADHGPYRGPELPAPLTQAGEVMGTPVYMAPEQAMGEELDERADVYAIGAILYQVLTGRWPHTGATSAQVIARLISGEQIPPIEGQQPDVPPDLAAIVTKAMRFEREARYPSASELAGDLRRFQTGQLVAAHHYSTGALVRRWIARRRAAVGVGATLLAALTATATVSVRSILHERNQTRAERDRLILSHARGDLDRDPTASVAWLKTYPADGADQVAARDLALQARARGVASHVVPSDPYSQAGSFSPDGRYYAAPSPTGSRIIELATGRTLSVSPRASALAWSPDSTRLAVTGRGGVGATSLVELTSGQAVALDGEVEHRWARNVEPFATDGASLVVPTPNDGLRRYARAGGPGAPVWTPFPVASYARFGERFAARSPEGGWAWWEPATAVAHPLTSPDGLTFDEADDDTSAAFLDDGRALIAPSHDGQLCVWTLADGAAQVVAGAGARVTQLRVSGDRRVVAFVAGADALALWRVGAATATALPRLGQVVDLALDQTGRRLVVGLQDRRVVVVDVQTGDQRVIGIERGEILRITLSADGRWVASDGGDGTTRLWPMPAALVERINHPEGVFGVAATSDGRAVVSVGGQDVVVQRDDGVTVLKGHRRSAGAVVISADDRVLVTGSLDESIRRWSLATGEPLGAPLDAHAGTVWNVATSRDGQRIVSIHGNGDVWAWDTAANTSRRLDAVPGTKPLALSADGRLAVAADRDGALHVLPLDGGPVRRLPGPKDLACGLALSPDARRAVSAGNEGHVVLWDLATGVARELPRRAGRACGVAFSADGRWVAASSQAGDVLLYDLVADQARPLTGAVLGFNVAFRGDELVTAGTDGAVRLWRLADGSERALLQADGDVEALVVRDRTIAVGTSAGRVYRWSAAELGDAPPPTTAPLAPFLDALTTATVDDAAHLSSVR